MIGVKERIAVGITRVLRGHLWLIVIVGTHFAAAMLMAPWFDKSILAPLNARRTLVMTSLFIISFLVLYPLRVLVFVRPQRPLQYIRQQFIAEYLTTERVLGAALSLCLVTAFAPAFSFFKSIIPIVQPFCWDEVLAELDRMTHLGYHPWQLMQPLMGYPVILMWIDQLYLIWFLVVTGTVVFHAFNTDRPLLRMQFFTTYILSWILLGNLFAVAFSSAGPCYYGRLVNGNDPYAHLMEHLRQVDQTHDLDALGIQRWLWEGYLSGDSSFGYGISAMPSMHVGVAFLLGLVGWHMSRAWGVLNWLYTAVVLVGSVQLGWHYAIDGYIAILGTWLLWHIVGRLLRRDAFFVGPISR